MVQVTGSKWEEVEGEADVNEVYLVVMWPQSPCSCLAWQLREIFISMLLLREGVTERGCLVWAQKHPTPSRPRGLSWLSALWGMLCALQSRRILPVLKVNSTTWSHPSLNSHLDPLLGPQRRYHRGSLDVWGSKKVEQHCKRGNTL